jgi:hemerythrin-like domain-containing protein
MVARMPNPLPLLLRQHDELLAKLDAGAAALAAVDAPLAEVVAYLELELETHFGIEERELFPSLAGRADIGSDTIALLLTEHTQARALVGELSRALRHGSVADRARLAQDVIDLLRAHVAKEDAMLLVVAAVVAR